MKFEVDIENSTLSEYFNESDGDLTFTDAFKEEVVRTFLNRIRFDDEIRNYIKSEIKDGLHLKVVSYKQDGAIKAIVEEVIKEELSPSRSGSYFYMQEYKSKVEKETKDALKQYEREINYLIATTIRNEIKTVMESLYKGNKMREFLDMDKLTDYVYNIMREQKESVDTE